MLSPAQKELLAMLEAAWSRRSRLRLGQLLDQASFGYGAGEPALVSDAELKDALEFFAGLKKP